MKSVYIYVDVEGGFPDNFLQAQTQYHIANRS